VSWTVNIHDDAFDELAKLPQRERQAIVHAVEKLEAIGPALGYPHTSDVKGADHLRELRPRAGRCQWRAFYRQVGATLVIGAIGPEAEVDPKGFKRAARAAEQRLSDE
jgi:hypothetical protein